MALLDEVTLELTGGTGGNGVVRWRSYGNNFKAGPGGGNGGIGGGIYAVTVRDVQVLSDYKMKKKFKAGNGTNGGGEGAHGHRGKEIELRMPIGSTLTNLETGETIELLEEGQKVLLVKGGSGGYGNEHFKSSTNTSPDKATKGKPGQTASFKVELKLIADIGLVGLPSAGKSTLLNTITNAQSKVGAYHFTTLEPHLGALPNGQIMADIPGLIEGASQGKGLGHKFLKHVSRTKTLLHCVSLESEDIIADYDTIRGELIAFDSELGDKPEIILLTKTDLLSEEELQKVIAKMKAHANTDQVYGISALTQEPDDIMKLLQVETAN